MRVISLLILGVLQVMIITLSAVHAPEPTPQEYWFVVAWVCFLIVANWYTTFFVFAGNLSRAPIFGALPAIGIVMGVTSSASILVAYLNLGDSPFLDASHATWQIIILGVGVFLMLMMRVADLSLYSSRAAKAMSKVEVSDCLKTLYLEVERHSEEQLLIDKLIDLISHDLAHDSKLAQDPRWVSLSNLISNIGTQGSDLAVLKQIDREVRKCM